MNKKLLKSLFIAIFAATLCVRMMPFAYATHTAAVKWSWASVPSFLLSSYTPFVHNMSIKAPIDWTKGIWVNFTVTNNAESADGISELKLIIPRNVNTNEAFFWFAEADLRELPSWTAVPDEFDPNGYPGVIHFQVGLGSPIAPGPLNARTLSVKFVNGPSTCTYKFMVYTIDNGLNKSPAETKPHTLYLMLDSTQPNVSIVHPPQENPEKLIRAIWAPYPDKHYMWINATANDLKKDANGAIHNSGILSVRVMVNNVTNTLKKYVSPWVDITKNVTGEKYYIAWTYYPNAPSPGVGIPYGDSQRKDIYKVTVEVTDKVGNVATASNTFRYVIPTPLQVSEWGFAATKTDLKDRITGLVEATASNIGTKILGTSIWANGTENSFSAGSLVTITVNIPTYTWYNSMYSSKYGPYEVLVKEKVKVGTNGGFTVSFVCPTVPKGVYKVTAIDEKGNKGIDYFEVKEEIAYDPEVIIGPAVIKAIATGLPSSVDVAGFTCDGTDALLTINKHVVEEWYTDINGTLKTHVATSPGFLMPVLQSGTYKIGLWREVESSSLVFMVDNKLTVANNFDELMDAIDEIFKIEGKLDYLKPIIERIDGGVAVIKTDVGTIKTDVKSLIDSITICKGDIAEIKTKVGTIQGKVDPINWNDVISIKTDLGTIKAKTDTIVWGDITTIKTDIGDIKVKIADLTPETLASILTNTEDVKSTTALSIPITAVLSAIAAIAAIAAAFVVTRRLKVAA